MHVPLNLLESLVYATTRLDYEIAHAPCNFFFINDLFFLLFGNLKIYYKNEFLSKETLFFLKLFHLHFFFQFNKQCNNLISQKYISFK